MIKRQDRVALGRTSLLVGTGFVPATFWKWTRNRLDLTPILAKPYFSPRYKVQTGYWLLHFFPRFEVLIGYCPRPGERVIWEYGLEAG